MGGSGSVFFLLLDHKKRFTLRGWVGLSKVLKLTLPYQDESHDDDNPNCKMIIMIKICRRRQQPGGLWAGLGGALAGGTGVQGAESRRGRWSLSSSEYDIRVSELDKKYRYWTNFRMVILFKSRLMETCSGSWSPSGEIVKEGGGVAPGPPGVKPLDRQMRKLLRKI